MDLHFLAIVESGDTGGGSGAVKTMWTMADYVDRLFSHKKRPTTSDCGTKGAGADLKDFLARKVAELFCGKGIRRSVGDACLTLDKADAADVPFAYVLPDRWGIHTCQRLLNLDK